MVRPKCLIVALLLAGVHGCGRGDEGAAPAPPAFNASLVCFIGKDGSGKSVRSGLAKAEGGGSKTSGKFACGSEGMISEITWTYRGHKDGKDRYHVVRTFPRGKLTAKTEQADVNFDGTRQVLFEDQSHCVVIEMEPAGK